MKKIILIKEFLHRGCIMSLTTLQKKISTFPEEYFDEIDSFLNLLEFKVKVLSAKEKQDAPKIIPGLAKGKWKYPKDINAFDNDVAEEFKEYL